MSFTNNEFVDNWIKLNYCKYLKLHAGHIFKTLTPWSKIAVNVNSCTFKPTWVIKSSFHHACLDGLWQPSGEVFFSGLNHV